MPARVQVATHLVQYWAVVRLLRWLKSDSTSNGARIIVGLVVALLVTGLGAATALWPASDGPGGPTSASGQTSVPTTSTSTSTTSTLPPTTTTSTAPPTSTTSPTSTTATPRVAILSDFEPVEGSVEIEQRSISGDPFLKAITLHLSQCGGKERTVQYDLSKDYQMLEGVMGLDDDSFSTLTARVVISIDGPNARSQTWDIRHGQAVRLALQVSEALRLKIVVTVTSKGPYSENSCTLGRLALGDARLLG